MNSLFMMRSKMCLSGLFVTLLSFLLLTPSFAQTDADKAEGELLKKEVLAFAQAYVNLPTSKDKGSVLKYVSKDLSSIILTNTITDNVKVVNSDYIGFSAYLDKVIRTSGLQITYEIQNFVRLQVRENVGLVIYTVNYEIIINGDSWSKGEETVTVTYRKNSDGWKMVHFTVIGLEDEKQKGTCLCETFGSGKGDFIVKTTIPSGRSYTSTMITFEFRNQMGGTVLNSKEVRFIRADSRHYQWLPNGELWSVSEGDLKRLNGVLLGTIKGIDELDVISLIIQKDLYTDNCGSIRMKQ